MAFRLSIQLGKSGKAGSIALKQIGGQFWQRLGDGFRRGGEILESQIKLNLSGLGRSAGPSKRARRLFKERAPFSRLNDFPGVVTGELRRSVKWKMRGAKSNLVLVVGPNKVYAAIHEFGGMAGRGKKVKIPARPYVWPSYEKQSKRILRVISEELLRR